MIDDVYNAKILELAAAVPDPERLADPDGSATKHSKLCGSQLRADIGLSGDAIDRVAMEVKACALGQAAAAVVHAHAPGATLDEVVAAREAMRAMLKEGGGAPRGAVRGPSLSGARARLPGAARLHATRDRSPGRGVRERGRRGLEDVGADVGERGRLTGRAQPSRRPAVANGRNYGGPWRRTPGRLLGIGLVRAYQLTLSPLIGQHCRHAPTCSEYAYEAIARHGLVAGGALAAWRVARCGPFGGHGYDPVPARLAWPRRLRRRGTRR